MTSSSFRQALLQRRVTIGTWLQINNPTAAEVLANAGYEWIAIDIEHTDIDIVSLTALLRGMYGRGAAPIARVSTNDVIEIRRALDVGAAGVLVPFVSTADQARRAVAAARYPPLGVRGFSFCRANNWGTDFSSEAQSANDNVAVVIMIESKEGVENIKDIAAWTAWMRCSSAPMTCPAPMASPGRSRRRWSATRATGSSRPAGEQTSRLACSSSVPRLRRCARRWKMALP